MEQTLLTITDLFKNSWDRCARGIHTYAMIALVLIVPAFIYSLLFTSDGGYGFLGMIGALVLIVAGALAMPALLLSMQDDGARPWREYVNAAKPLILRYAALSIVRGILVVIGFLLLIIPGVILLVVWGVADVALVFEKRTMGASLGQSRAYVKGRFMPVAVRIILFTVVAMAAVLVLSMVSGIVPFTIGAMAVYHAGLIFIVSWAAAFQFELYHDLVRTKDALMVRN